MERQKTTDFIKSHLVGFDPTSKIQIFCSEHKGIRLQIQDLNDDEVYSFLREHLDHGCYFLTPDDQRIEISSESDLPPTPPLKEAEPVPQDPNNPPLPIPGGYILLARKLLNSEVMGSPALVLKFWVWCLLQASFKDHGDLKRGQFFTRLKDIQKAMAHKIGFRIVRPSIKEIRGAMKILMKGHMMGTMKVTHGRIITIRNYNYYQNIKNYEGHNEGQSTGHTEGTIPRKKGSKEGKDPGAISAEISALVSKLFPGKESLFQEVKAAISSTRKTGKLSPGVILSLLQSLEGFPQEKILAGIQTYLNRQCWKQGKNEKYLIGIVRNESNKPVQPQGFKSTGSPLMDAYYRKQAERGAGQ